MSTLLTPEEVADRLRIDNRTLMRYVREGRIPAFKITNKCIRFREEAVQLALEASRS